MLTARRPVRCWSGQPRARHDPAPAVAGRAVTGAVRHLLGQHDRCDRAGEHPDRFECRSQRPAMDRQCVRPHLRGADAHFRHPRRPSRTAGRHAGGVGGVHRRLDPGLGRLYQRDSHRGPGGDGRRGGRLRAGHPVDDPSALSRSRRTGSSPRRVGSRLRSRPGLGTGHRRVARRRVVVASGLRLQHRSRTGRHRRRVADPAGGDQPRPAALGRVGVRPGCGGPHRRHLRHHRRRDRGIRKLVDRPAPGSPSAPRWHLCM